MTESNEDTCRFVQKIENRWKDTTKGNVSGEMLQLATLFFRPTGKDDDGCELPLGSCNAEEGLPKVAKGKQIFLIKISW